MEMEVLAMYLSSAAEGLGRGQLTGHIDQHLVHERNARHTNALLAPLHDA